MGEQTRVCSLCFIIPFMVKVISGYRVAKEGRLSVGCSASIFDARREKVLLVRRTDNGKWAVPGGYMESGESFSEACRRELLEETGLEVKVKHLIGIFTSPNLLLVYPDGNKWQLVILHFEAELANGDLRPSDETKAFGYFSLPEIELLDMGRLDRERVMAGFTNSSSAAIKVDLSIG